MRYRFLHWNPLFEIDFPEGQTVSGLAVGTSNKWAMGMVLGEVPAAAPSGLIEPEGWEPVEAGGRTGLRGAWRHIIRAMRYIRPMDSGILGATQTLPRNAH